MKKAAGARRLPLCCLEKSKGKLVGAELHVGVDPLHAVVGEVLVEEGVHRRGGRLPLDPLGPAAHRQQAHGAVKDHEQHQHPGEDLAEPVGELQDYLGGAGVDALDPQHPQDAPEQGVQQADAAVEVEGHIAVVPGGGAEQRLLPPGEQVLDDAAHDGSAEEGDGGAAVAVAVQRQGHDHGADAVDRVEGAVHQAGAALQIAVAEEAPQQFHHHAGKAAGHVDQHHLVEVDAGGEAVRPLLLQVDDGVGGCVAEQALPLGALLPLPQAGGQLVRLVRRPLMGLPQAGGGVLQRLHLPGDVAVQGGPVLRGEVLLLRQLLIVTLIPDLQGLFHSQHILAAFQQILLFHRHLLPNQVESLSVYHKRRAGASRSGKSGAKFVQNQGLPRVQQKNPATKVAGFLGVQL